MQVDLYPRLKIESMGPTQQGMEIEFTNREPILIKPQESITLDYADEYPYTVYIEIRPKRRKTDAKSTN